MPKIMEYNLEEIQSHNSFSDGWVIIKGYVYDITPILDDHNPGIKNVLGRDATETFTLFHGQSRKVKKKIKKYQIGKVQKDKPKNILRLVFSCLR